GTYFFTVNLADRSSTLLIDKIDALRSVFQKIKLQHPFEIEAMVVLPDHLHSIWTLPPDDDDYATRWSLIKAAFSRQIPVNEKRNPSRLLKAERGIWQRRYWEHLIRDEQDFNHHMNYIHYNPVKHGHAQNPVDWLHSSIHRYIAKGTLQADWGSGVDFGNINFGEN
ncbi:MAG TPA: transposase, partial [Gammaproteobacteria bacterium]|nr:transposase [Gammaproteobacteria bacterium]